MFDDIIVMIGGFEVIQFVMLFCFDIGDEVIVFELFYVNYNGFVQIGSLNIWLIICDIEDGFVLFLVEVFEVVIIDKIWGIFIINLNNFIGCFYSWEDLIQLGCLCKVYDLFLFVDEVYWEFCYDGKEFYLAFCLEGLEDYVIVVDFILKCYSVCGVCIGVLVICNQGVLEVVICYVKFCLSFLGLVQILVEVIFDMDDSYFGQVIEVYDCCWQVVYNCL